MAKLKEEPDFIPCTPVMGDEMLGGYPFKWNVTQAALIEKNLDKVELSTVQVNPPGPGAGSAAWMKTSYQKRICRGRW
ncbi:hypothetical protein [Planococcus glaciei]|uniref:hypothetical protein n=1 Tax=Planococcus glaciei TaxID=459472 RepID=UPI001C73D8B7|nr:hypothetical protein [Planococcus glaciei]MBX0313296.1 hypothetical protein [Planococcus glaciei]